MAFCPAMRDKQSRELFMPRYMKGAAKVADAALLYATQQGVYDLAVPFT